MKTRIITALICIPLLVTVLVAPGYVICGAVVLVSIIGLSEFYGAVGLADKKPLTAIGYASALIIPIFMYFKPYAAEYFALGERLPAYLLVYLFILALFAVMLIFHKNVSISDAALTMFSTVYIPYLLSHIILVRESQNGEYLIWLIFIGAFLADTGAYFVGIFFGRHKLCPEISPKKTIEGAFGGVLGGVVFYIVYGLILKYAFNFSVRFASLALMGVIISVISEIGDLSASIIKRHYGIKDYGTLFPGHGGILDRCDSVIMVAPAVYLLLNSVFTVIL